MVVENNCMAQGSALHAYTSNSTVSSFYSPSTLYNKLPSQLCSMLSVFGFIEISTGLVPVTSHP